jgi:diacylglycerol kinase (ATP)
LFRIWRATLNSWRGMIAAARSGTGVPRGLVALAIAVPLAFVVAAESWKRFMLIGVVLLLMAVELLNTAIEKLSDHVTPAQHPDIGRVKDMGSAAVGVRDGDRGLHLAAGGCRADRADLMALPRRRGIAKSFA